MKLVFHMEAWRQVVQSVVNENLVPRAEKIADKCNREMRSQWRVDKSYYGGTKLPDYLDDGYVAGTISIEGGPALIKRDYRATVITRTQAAKHDNARYDRLVKNLYLAGEGAKRFAQRVFKQAREKGGATIDLEGGEPTTGYAYAPAKGTETIVELRDFTQADVDRFIDRNFAALNRDGNHIGLWQEGDKFYLDVSRVGPATEATIRAAQEAQQLAVFDFDSFQSIDIGTIVDGQYKPK